MRKWTALVLLLCLFAGGLCPLKASAAQSGSTADDGKIIFVGDSRTLGMYWVRTNQRDRTYINTTDPFGDRWSIGSGEGFEWMTSTGVPRIDGEVDSRSSVVLMLGINDCLTPSMAERYCEYINQKAAEWKAKGAEVYYVSVNPVRGVTSSGISNAAVDSFNAAVRAGLSENVSFIDINSQLKGNISFYDDLHYNDVTNLAVYELVTDVVKKAYQYKQQLLAQLLEQKRQEEEAARAAAEAARQAEQAAAAADSGTAVVAGDNRNAVTQAQMAEKMNRINSGYLPIYFARFQQQGMGFDIFLNTQGILCVRLQQDGNTIRYLEYAADMPDGSQGIYHYYEAPLRADGSWLPSEAKLQAAFVYNYADGTIYP